MLVQPKCISCILEDVIAAIEILVADENKQKYLIKKILQAIQDFNFDKLPSYYITKVHRILKKELGIEILFLEKRRICNQIGIRIAERVEQRAKKLEGFERFTFLVAWSIAGNRLDFRTAGEGYLFEDSEIEKMLSQNIAQGFAVNDLSKIWNFIQEKPTILYVLDNVGEIAFDKILISRLREMGCHVTAALRSGAITSDATIEDGLEVGIDKVANQVIIACPDTLGISFEEATKDFFAALKRSDLVISKGQANYYAFSEKEESAKYRIAYFLTTKCELVSKEFDQKGKVNIAKFA